MSEPMTDPGRESAPADAFGLLAAWNYSIFAFYLRRFQRMAEFPMRVARTATPSDLIEARRAFEEDLVADYRDQASVLHHACGRPAAAVDPVYGAELLKAQDHARQLLDQAKAQAERIIASAEERAAAIVSAAKPGAPRRASA